MSKEFVESAVTSSAASTSGRRAGARAVKIAIVATLAVTVGALSAGPSSAANTAVQAAAVSSVALAVPAAPTAAVPSRLSGFDATLLAMINAKRAAVGAVALREVVGLDNVSAGWSGGLVALGRYGNVVPNPNIAAQTLSAAPTRGAFAQSTAKWYPRTVKPADVFLLYTSYPQAMANMTNRNYRFVGIRTVVAADGTSVATLTYTDNAIAAQVVNPTPATNPTGAVTSAVQAGASVQLRGRAADRDATRAVQVKLTDTIGTRVTTVTATVAGGLFAGTVPLIGYGVHRLCATVVNQGAGANLSLGCTTANLNSLAGNAEALRQSGTQLTASGWGYDPAAARTPLKATVVLRGPSGSRTITLVAGVNRPDVGRARPVAGPLHGFAFAVPTLGRGVTTMCVTLLPASPVSIAQQLTCRSIVVR